MNQKHCKPNGKRSQNRDMRISGISLGIGSGEDGVDENEGTDDLSTEAAAFGVARGDEVRKKQQMEFLDAPSVWARRNRTTNIRIYSSMLLE